MPGESTARALELEAFGSVFPPLSAVARLPVQRRDIKFRSVFMKLVPIAPEKPETKRRLSDLVNEIQSVPT